jgi:hypothetical protein
MYNWVRLQVGHAPSYMRTYSCGTHAPSCAAPSYTVYPKISYRYCRYGSFLLI